MSNTINFNEKIGFICDMDGVIYHGNKILPGVKEFIDWLFKNKKRFLFLTNNSGLTPFELRQKLSRMGLDVAEEHFYTSALATAEFLKSQAPGCSAYKRTLQCRNFYERRKSRLCRNRRSEIL